MNNYFLFWWHIRVSKSITHFNKMLQRARSRARARARRCAFTGDERGALQDLLPHSLRFCQVIRQALDKYISLIPSPGRLPQFVFLLDGANYMMHQRN